MPAPSLLATGCLMRCAAGAHRPRPKGRALIPPRGLSPTRRILRT
jgi:hypothetical protein